MDTNASTQPPRIRIGSIEIELSKHSIHRYAEHFLPCGDDAAALDRLSRLTEHNGVLCDERPAWVTPMGGGEEAVAYVEVPGIFALPLVPRGMTGAFIAKTCIARGCITHAERDRRRHRRRACGRRQARRRR